MSDISVAKKVDELVKWSSLLDDCKREIEVLKGNFDRLGQEQLADKKIKQVEFWGTGNSKVVVTESETLKVQYDCVIEELFSKIKNGLIRMEPSYKYAEPFKRVLISILQGSYIDETFDAAIQQISVDDKTKKVLRKKLKGKWDKDVETLQNMAGLSKEDAEYYAFQIQEAMNYEKILALMKTAGYEMGTEKFNAAMDTIKAAAIVETGLKIGIETA